MIEQDKLFFVGKRADGRKEVIYNWKHNIGDKIYPEYKTWEGPFDTREQAHEIVLNSLGLTSK